MSLYKQIHDEGGAVAVAEQPVRNPALDELRQRLHEHLVEKLGPVLFDKRVSQDDLRARVVEHLQQTLATERTPLSATEKAGLVQDIVDDVLGYGPIDAILQDDSGIPFRSFDQSKWSIRYFGDYHAPIELFAKHAQPELRAAYAANPKTPLPFGSGYRYAPWEANLILATKR